MDGSRCYRCPPGLSVSSGTPVIGMRVKHFRDTDTALLEFLDATVETTREINEDVYIDLDAKGDVVAMTIEHARRNSELPDVLVQEFDKRTA